MHSRRPLNWVQWVSLFTALAVAVLLPFVIIRVQDAHHDTNQTIRSLLCYFEANTIRNPQVSRAEKQRTVRLFNAALAQINEPACP